MDRLSALVPDGLSSPPADPARTEPRPGGGRVLVPPGGVQGDTRFVDPDGARDEEEGGLVAVLPFWRRRSFQIAFGVAVVFALLGTFNRQSPPVDAEPGADAGSGVTSASAFAGRGDSTTTPFLHPGGEAVVVAEGADSVSVRPVGGGAPTPMDDGDPVDLPSGSYLIDVTADGVWNLTWTAGGT